MIRFILGFIFGTFFCYFLGKISLLSWRRVWLVLRRGVKDFFSQRNIPLHDKYVGYSRAKPLDLKNDTGIIVDDYADYFMDQGVFGGRRSFPEDLDDME